VFASALRKTSILQCEIPISILRVGRFVDAKEGESECKLCERVGFVTFSSWKCPFVSASEGRSGAQQAFCNVKSLSLFFARVIFGCY